MLHIVTVATKNEGYFSILQKSCEKNGGKLEVLGWGQEWKGFGMKINLMKDYLDTLNKNDIVCFVDGYDVVILQPLQQMERLFIESNKNIIFSLDCIQDEHSIKSFILKTYFGQCKEYSINSGTYIGYVKDLKDLMNSLYKQFTVLNSNDDQILFTKICNLRDDVYVDDKKELFLVVDDTKKIHIENKQIVHNDRYPCVLHAVANININNILEELGYDTKCIKIRSNTQYFMKNPILRVIVIAILLITLLFILFLMIRR